MSTITVREVSHVVTLIQKSKRTADSKTFTAQSLIITANSVTASLRPALISSPQPRPHIVIKVLSFLRTHSCNTHYRRFHKEFAHYSQSFIFMKKYNLFFISYSFLNLQPALYVCTNDIPYVESKKGGSVLVWKIF